MRYSRLLIAIFALAVAGCTGESSTPSADTPDAEENRNVNIDPQLERFVSQARSDLARRLEIDETEISVVDADFVTWPNSAVGCTEPDMMYSQALVPGYRIRLRADGTLHHYHGKTDGPPFHCPAERVSEPAAGNANPKDVT